MQDRPINLEVPKKPWYPAPAPPTSLGLVQDQPVDFSKKKGAESSGQQRGAAVPAHFKRQYQFQRNLLVILLQNLRRAPARGRHTVRYLKQACDKIQTRGCSGGKNGTPGGGGGVGGGGQGGHQAGGGAGAGAGAGAGQYSGGGQNSTGGSPNSSRSNSTDQDESGNNLFDVSETDFDSIDFDFNESATRKWISDNPDLSPLKVLDHISFKPDPAPDLHHQDAPKPPDLATLDRDTASILQLAVPVPDPSSTFLDIGTDFGPVSFYEDDPFNLEQLVPSTFNLNNMNNSGGVSASSGVSAASHHQPLYPIHHQNNNTAPPPQPLHLNSNIILQQHSRPHHAHPAPAPAPAPAKLAPLELTSQLNFHSFLPDPAAASSPVTRHLADNHNTIKQYCAVKTEPQQQQQQHTFYPQPIKEESPCYHETSYPDLGPGPASPPTPSSCHSGHGGGKMRTSPQRKKSTSSSNDEEDLMNVPSLQMRIQILQQRVSTKSIIENYNHIINSPRYSSGSPRTRRWS